MAQPNPQDIKKIEESYLYLEFKIITPHNLL